MVRFDLLPHHFDFHRSLLSLVCVSFSLFRPFARTAGTRLAPSLVRRAEVDGRPGTVNTGTRRGAPPARPRCPSGRARDPLPRLCSWTTKRPSIMTCLLEWLGSSQTSATTSAVASGSRQTGLFADLGIAGSRDTVVAEQSLEAHRWSTGLSLAEYLLPEGRWIRYARNQCASAIDVTPADNSLHGWVDTAGGRIPSCSDCRAAEWFRQQRSPRRWISLSMSSSRASSVRRAIPSLRLVPLRKTASPT